MSRKSKRIAFWIPILKLSWFRSLTHMKFLPKVAHLRASTSPILLNFIILTKVLIWSSSLSKSRRELVEMLSWRMIQKGHMLNNNLSSPCNLSVFLREGILGMVSPWCNNLSSQDMLTTNSRLNMPNSSNTVIKWEAKLLMANLFSLSNNIPALVWTHKLRVDNSMVNNQVWDGDWKKEFIEWIMYFG